MSHSNKYVLFQAIKTLIEADVLYGTHKNRIKLSIFREAEKFMKTRKSQFTPDIAMEVWNTHAHELLPRVKELTRSRIARVGKLAKEFTIDDFKNAIEKVNNNNWALGKSENKKYRGWRFNFDYIIKKGILRRILEGWLDEPEVLDDIDRRERFKK